MKNKRIVSLLATLIGLSLSVTACNFGTTPKQSSANTQSSNSSVSSKTGERNEQIYAIYLLYKEASANPVSYEEWLASIRGEPGEPGHSPVIAINNDGYWTIDGVSTGVKANGNPGSPGTPGKDGTSLITGQGEPASTLGVAGDSYIDLASWNYYTKSQNGWTRVGNIGRSDLNSLKTGSGAPDSLLGQNGDSYVNTDTWDFYVKNANGWQFVANIKGTNGQTAWSNTILPSEHGYITVNVGSALVGTEVIFTAYPDNGYYLSELEMNGQSVINAVVNNTYRTKMVENGFVVRAIFSEGSAPAHTHTYKTTYDYDDTNHWQECIAGDAIRNKANHSYSDWITDVPATETTDGREYRQCSVCGYIQENVIPKTVHTHVYNGWSSNASSHYHECTGCGEITDINAHSFEEDSRVEPTETVDGYILEKCSVCGYEKQTVLPAEQQRFNVYATNDIHGQIYQELGDGYVERVGIDKYMTYLKNKKAEGNALLLDQGDTWQGSVYSNYNRGGLITDLMNYVQFDARTVGNHDFDWGVQPVVTNAAKAYNGYTTPTLAANVYDYNFATKTEGVNQQSQIGRTSVTYTIGGVKIGIIGTIGSSQITSICTNIVKDICFKPHIPIIKAEAQRLRENENCDVVILSHHGDQDDLTGENLNQFIDLALCAHSHQLESFWEGGLLYVQGRSNNRYVYEIDFIYNRRSGVLRNDSNFYYSAQYIDNVISSADIDSTIKNMVTTNYQMCIAQEPLNEIVASNVYGTFTESETAANLMADAIYEEAIAEGYTDIYCAYVNQSRHDLGEGSWTYADVYEAFPFENTVYIMEVTAEEMVNEVGSWNCLRKNMDKWPNYFDVNDTTTKYRIAAIDYLGVHTNADRQYDYFPTGSTRLVATLNKTYRPILVDYLKNHNYNKGTALYASDYSTNVAKFKRNGSAPTKPCTLTFMMNDGSGDTYITLSGNQNDMISSAYPNTPSRSNYRFTGWYFDANCTEPANGRIKEDVTLYAGWAYDSGNTYTFRFEKASLLNDSGNYQTGERTFYVQAIGASGSVEVTVYFESAKYHNSYDEFGLSAGTGMTITPASGYVITGYSMDTYYDSIEFYSDSSRTKKYQFGNVSSNSTRYSHTGSGLNYPSLYLYNTYTGISYIYFLELIIERA